MTKKLTLIKRTTPFCGACRMVEVQLNGAGIEYKTIDITYEPEAVNKYGLTGVPVMIIEEDGKEIERLAGFYPADVIQAKLIND